MKSIAVLPPLALIFLASVGCEKAPQFKTRTVIKQDGYQLQVMDNSDTISQAIAINAHGHVLGIRETLSKTKGVFKNYHFFDDGQKSIDLPQLEGFTNSEVEALSDTGIAVGYASRALGNPEGTLTALLWDTKANKLLKLPHIEGDLVSHAQDISADGKRIVGYSTGNDPERLRPCLWEFSEGEEKWVATALPSKLAYNPYTMSSSVKISPDGKTIVGCATSSMEGRTLDSDLYVWKQDEESQWQQKLLHEEQIYVGDVNDAGYVVGDASDRKKGTRIPCVIAPGGERSDLEMFDGTVSGKAYDINNQGLVIGICDDPQGPEGGPHPFVYNVDANDGKLSPVKLPAENLYCIVQAINESGQIAGLGEITFEDRLEKNPETGKEEPVVKALAFIWDPM